MLGGYLQRTPRYPAYVYCTLSNTYKRKGDESRFMEDGFVDAFDLRLKESSREVSAQCQSETSLAAFLYGGVFSSVEDLFQARCPEVSEHAT